MFLGTRTSGIVLWIWGCSSVRVFTTQDPRIGSPFFSDFVHEVSHKVRKLTKCDFWKKSWQDKRAWKLTKGSKNEVSGVLKKIYVMHSYVLFYLDIEVTMVFYVPAKTRCLVKIWFLSNGPKPLDQSDCRIL